MAEDNMTSPHEVVEIANNVEPGRCNRWEIRISINLNTVWHFILTSVRIVNECPEQSDAV